MRGFAFHLMVLVVLIAVKMQNDGVVVWASPYTLFIVNELDVEAKVKLVSSKNDGKGMEINDRVISCSIAKKPSRRKGTEIRILLADEDCMILGTFFMKKGNIRHIRQEIAIHKAYGSYIGKKRVRIMEAGVSNMGRTAKWNSTSTDLEFETQSESHVIDGVATYVFPYEEAALSSFLQSSSSSSTMQINQSAASSESTDTSSNIPTPSLFPYNAMPPALLHHEYEHPIINSHSNAVHAPLHLQYEHPIINSHSNAVHAPLHPQYDTHYFPDHYFPDQRYHLQQYWDPYLQHHIFGSQLIHDANYIETIHDQNQPSNSVTSEYDHMIPHTTHPNEGSRNNNTHVSG